LHAALTHLLQPRNDRVQAELIATFSTIRAAVDGSVFDANNSHSWVKFRCKSTSCCPISRNKGLHVGHFWMQIMGLSGSVLDANQQTEHYFGKAYGVIGINVKVIF